MRVVANHPASLIVCRDNIRVGVWLAVCPPSTDPSAMLCPSQPVGWVVVSIY